MYLDNPTMNIICKSPYSTKTFEFNGNLFDIDFMYGGPRQTIGWLNEISIFQTKQQQQQGDGGPGV